MPVTFLHPWVLAIGAAAAAAPVIVHWLTRPRPVRMPLSTLRFVREAIQQRRARHRLRDAIVLALRTAAILCLAGAIARPQLGPQPLVWDRDADAAVRVVVLDVSQSMGAVYKSVRAVERARKKAEEFLRYRPGLSADLVVAAAQARPVFGRPSTNFEALREELSRVEVLPQRLDARAALAAAGQLLAKTSEQDRRRRELVVISDFQASNWQLGAAPAAATARGEDVRAFSELVPEGTQIQLEPAVPPGEAANVAILRGECRVRGAESRQAQLAVEVANYTPGAQDVAVEAALGDAVWRLAGSCPKGRSVTLTQDIELGASGWQSGQVQLVGIEDALAADNARPLAVRVRPRPTFVLLTQQPAGRKASSSLFLECALAPEGRSKAEAAPLVRRLHPASAGPQALAAADLIVADHPGQLGEETVKLLSDLVRRGRPLLYVAAEPADASNLVRLGRAAGDLRLPVSFAPPPPRQVRRDLTIVAKRAAEPPFAAFGDALDKAVASWRFTGGLVSQPAPDGLKSDILATLDDGSALLVQGTCGAGSVVVLNADLAESTLAKSGSFAALVAELVERMLQHGGARREALAGQLLAEPLPPEAGGAAGLRVVDGQDREAAAGQLVDEGAGATWRWTSPDPGVYRVKRGTETVYALAVQVPPEESDLKTLKKEILADRLVGGAAVYYHGLTPEDQRRDDLWTWLAAACAVCLVGELGALLGFRT